MTRIALIHALAASMAPVNDALARDWPQALPVNLLDDSLSVDLARSGRLTDAMTQRFHALADYAVGSGAQAVLFTCSAFGPCIESVARRHAGLPVLKPNEAMVDEAVARMRESGARIGLVASFAPTLASMPAEFPADVAVRTALAEGALAALERGEPALHDRLVAQAAHELAAAGCTVIALAQFSLARARHAVEERTALPVLTTVDSAIARLRRRLR